MKLVFRTTPPKQVQIPARQPPIIFYTTRSSFSGNMLDRIKSNGQPCGSCGGR
jgi:hypothetical protein